MGKRRDMIRKCALVRDLLQENQFTAALELMDELPLEEVTSIEDLYLFADLYEKAERMDKKKEIFYLIYDRTQSRHVLNRLLRLVLRMGDMAEARELFLAYEFGNEVTLDTFELRYLIARAEGESRSALIHILEELKAEEYTEEWGYQLARLYEQEGMRQECICECKDLQLWFGEGKIVEKARELQARCESPDWQPPKDEDIPEPEEPEKDEIIAYAAHPVKITDLGDSEEEEEPRERIAFMEPEVDKEFLGEAVTEVVKEVAAEKDIRSNEVAATEEGVLVDEGVSEVLKEPERPQAAREKKTEAVKNALLGWGFARGTKKPKEEEHTLSDGLSGEGVGEVRKTPKALMEKQMEQPIEQPKEETAVNKEMDLSEEMNPMRGQIPDIRKEVDRILQEGALKSSPEEREQPRQEEKKEPVENSDNFIQDEPEDISERGIHYFTLKRTINQLRQNQQEAHFVFAGGEERITLAVAKRITKELNHVGYFSAGSIVKIAADKLNELKLEEQMEKLSGSCMLVTNAPEMNNSAVMDLFDIMEEKEDQIVVMLSGPFDEMDCFLASHTDLSDKLTYKVRM